MDFLKALELMIEGNKVYSKTINKKNHVIYIEEGILYCQSCGDNPKLITLDMIKDKNWRKYKNDIR